MTLESIAWRGTHVELPPAGDAVLVYGPLLIGPAVGGRASRVWMGRLFDGAWVSLSGVTLPNVTHWAELPTGADP